MMMDMFRSIGYIWKHANGWEACRCEMMLKSTTLEDRQAFLGMRHKLCESGAAGRSDGANSSAGSEHSGPVGSCCRPDEESKAASLLAIHTSA